MVANTGGSKLRVRILIVTKTFNMIFLVVVSYDWSNNFGSVERMLKSSGSRNSRHLAESIKQQFLRKSIRSIQQDSLSTQNSSKFGWEGYKVVVAVK